MILFSSKLNLNINDYKNSKIIQSLKSNLEDKKIELKVISTYSPTVTKTTKKGKEFTRKLVSCEADYPNLLDVIFSHGKTNYKIWFLNKQCKVCLVTKCETVKGEHMLTCIIDVHDLYKRTYMTLDRFLYLVEIGDFKITNDKFNKYYMKPYSESKYIKEKKSRIISEIRALEKQIEQLENNK